MDHREAGQGTPFDSMTHETMLAWLDKANSGAIQGASDRLLSAATEIRKIAEDLKVRPQTVEWKGEGATAFRTWGADLANATLRLGDYSEGASKWLAQASDALASAQVAIPRTDAGAQANLDAAKAARNDPDASAIEKKSLETLLAAKESNRQEAAAEMRRLAQSYQFSASQMDGLEKPVFPPPPGEFVPDRKETISDGETWGSTGSGPGGHSGSSRTTYGSSASTSDINGVLGSSIPHGLKVPVHSDTPVDMEIDGVATLPPTSSTNTVTPSVPPTTGNAEGVLPPRLMNTPRPFGGGPIPLQGPVAGGKAVSGLRPPALPGQGGLTAGPASRLPREGGIIGGRPLRKPLDGRPEVCPVARWSVARDRTLVVHPWGMVLGWEALEAAKVALSVAVAWLARPAVWWEGALNRLAVRAGARSHPGARAWCETPHPRRAAVAAVPVVVASQYSGLANRVATRVSGRTTSLRTRRPGSKVVSASFRLSSTDQSVPAKDSDA